MYDKETRQKIESCKALQGKTVQDFVNDARFRLNLAKYIEAQRADRKAIRASYEAMRKVGGAKGYKLPAHPIDRLMELNTGEFAAEFLCVIGKVSKRSAAERQYILQLGMQAYNLTVAQYVVEEYPELEPVLIPKSKTN